MTTPRAVIFDMDGVLVLSGPAHWIAWREVAQLHGIELTKQQFLSFNGFTNPDIVAHLWGKSATVDFADRIAVYKEKAFRDAIMAAVPLAPGAIPLLQALREADYRIAVGSSAPPENVNLVLDNGDIRPFFGAVVHAEMVVRGKPAPDIFLLAAKLLDVPPTQCIVIEDAPSGIRAAGAAGMPAIGVLTNHSADELIEAGASIVVPDLAAVQLATIASIGLG